MLASAIVCAVSTGTYAQAPAAQNPPPKTGWAAWEKSAAAGLTLSKGNSDSLLGTITLQAARKWQKDEFSTGVGGAYGEQKSVANQESISGYMQYNRLFSEKFYGGLRLDGLYDRYAGVDYRLKVSPMLGYYLIKSPRTSLAFEAGPTLVMENLKAPEPPPAGPPVPAESFLGARVGERFEHKLSDTTKIWQSFEYVARVDDWSEKFLLTGEIGIDTAITKQLSLRVVFQDIYDNKPAAGRKKNDIRLISGIAYKF